MTLKSNKIQRNINKSKTFKKRVINFLNRTNNKNSSKNCSNEIIINHCAQTHKNNEPPRKNKRKNKTIFNTININMNNFSNFQISNNNNKELIEKKTLKKKKYYDDYQLNEMEYNEAVQLDKRPFFQMYWSILKREHMIIFLFYLDDYNIPCIKFARAFFLICTDMALNVFFFSDDSMHKIYLNYGKYNFIQQIPQIVYTTIVSQLIQVFICFLSLTDKHVYQIKDLTKIKKNEIFHILNCIRIKLLGFFLVTIILFIFYWYLISTFCEIYINTQSAFIKDSIISLITGLLYPFALYLFPCILRKIALNDSNKRLKIIYKLSYIIPIF
jgi:hypothetical protein